jgi:hypothetical protein
MSAHPYALNLLVNMFAVLVFVVLMCLFWWLVGSTEVRRTVERKGELLHALRRAAAHSQVLDVRASADLLDAKMYALEHGSREAAKRNEAGRRAYNLALLYMYVFPIVALLLCAVGGLAVHNVVMTRRANRPHTLTFGHWFGLPGAVLGYLPEVLFFLLVVERYVILGDFELVRRACGLYWEPE